MSTSLATMDRETLFALDDYQVLELCQAHNIEFPIGKRTPDNYWKAIFERWEQLQQSAAESRHDTQTER